MPIEIGEIEAIFRYPVKSMRGESLAGATLGWHGLDGDRRLAFRRLDGHSDFPWLTASMFPDLICFTPRRRQDANTDALPTHVLTPEGDEMPIFDDALAAAIGRRCGHRVEMMQLKHGVFDDASISMITSDTVCEMSELASGRSCLFVRGSAARFDQPQSDQDHIVDVDHAPLSKESLVSGDERRQLFILLPFEGVPI